MANEVKSTTGRLYSLDALRGFDMFWIMGGEAIFTGLATLTGWTIFEWWAKQLDHVPWHGFVFYDMIFPLYRGNFISILAGKKDSKERQPQLNLQACDRPGPDPCFPGYHI